MGKPRGRSPGALGWRGCSPVRSVPGSPLGLRRARIFRTWRILPAVLTRGVSAPSRARMVAQWCGGAVCLAARRAPAGPGVFQFTRPSGASRQVWGAWRCDGDGPAGWALPSMTALGGPSGGTVMFPFLPGLP